MTNKYLEKIAAKSPFQHTDEVHKNRRYDQSNFAKGMEDRFVTATRRLNRILDVAGKKRQVARGKLGVAVGVTAGVAGAAALALKKKKD